MTFLIPHDEALSIIGPFGPNDDVHAFYQQHMHGFGAEVRDSCTPEDWIAAMDDESEEP